MRQYPIEDCEIMACVYHTGSTGRGRRRAEQGAVGVLADANVQAEDARAVQVRGTIEIAVVLGHDGGEREPKLRLKVPLRVVDEERITPGDLRGAACLIGTLHIHASE